MVKPMPYSAITRGIVVSVEPTFLEAQSSPHESKYVWAYRIVIENRGSETVQLRSRHWRIMNALGAVREVQGEGVVGEQPVLKAGEVYEYSSGTPLNTPSGLMIGTYQMQTEGGEIFDVEIPSFSLDSPHHTNFVH
jgi:ApaG protein